MDDLKSKIDDMKRDCARCCDDDFIKVNVRWMRELTRASENLMAERDNLLRSLENVVRQSIRKGLSGHFTNSEVDVYADMAAKTLRLESSKITRRADDAVEQSNCDCGRCRRGLRTENCLNCGGHIMPASAGSDTDE